MDSSLLKIQDISKQFGGVQALSNCNLTIHPGELVGLLGSNGAGKTTLFNLITGFLTPDSGTITFRNTNLLPLPPDRITHLGITRTFQQLRLIRQLTVLENLLLAFPRQPGEHLPNLFLRPQLTAAKEKKHRDQAMNILQDIGLIAKHNSLTDDLSYGQQKLLSIGCCLATGADLLLLDEPIAGVSPALIDQILSIIQALPQQDKSVLLIEHNMDVVMNLCNRLIFIDAGTVVCEGSPASVRNDPRVIAAYL
jgi:ABC-type branched-subunit amino acid transport system ATPase component